MAHQGIQALFLNNYGCRKLMEVYDWEDEDWDDDEKVGDMLSVTGLICSKDTQFNAHRLCRKPSDPIMYSLEERQLRVWDNEWVVAIAFEDGHWKGKLIEVGSNGLRIYSLEPGKQKDPNNENDRFDECIAKIAAHHLFRPDDMEQVAVNFATGIPGSLFGKPDDIVIPPRGDSKSCFVYALRDLCIAFKFLPLRFDEQFVKPMRLSLFDVMMAPSDWRNKIGPTPGMRMLSVRQPWADHILSGKKLIENRNWALFNNAKNVWIAIHASRTLDEEYCVPERLEEHTKRAGHILGMCFCECAMQIEGGNFLFHVLRSGQIPASFD